jgi:hypothetical protein
VLLLIHLILLKGPFIAKIMQIVSLGNRLEIVLRWLIKLLRSKEGAFMEDLSIVF